MKRIGLLSDTHGYWDEKYREYFAECDEIWHAGDIGSMEIAQRLNEIKPLRAVCGNCDGGDLRIMYPEKLCWNCEGAEVLMKHIGGYPGNYDRSIREQIMRRPPKLFISGHSHILKVETRSVSKIARYVGIKTTCAIIGTPIHFTAFLPVERSGAVSSTI